MKCNLFKKACNVKSFNGGVLTQNIYLVHCFGDDQLNVLNVEYSIYRIPVFTISILQSMFFYLYTTEDQNASSKPN